MVFFFNRKYTLSVGYQLVQEKYDVMYGDDTGSLTITLELEHFRLTYWDRRIYFESESSGDLQVLGMTNVSCFAYQNGIPSHPFERNLDPPARHIQNIIRLSGLAKNTNITIMGVAVLKFIYGEEIQTESINFHVSNKIIYSLEEMTYLNYTLLLVEFTLIGIIAIFSVITIGNINTLFRTNRAPDERKERERKFAQYIREREKEQLEEH